MVGEQDGRRTFADALSEPLTSVRSVIHPYDTAANVILDTSHWNTNSGPRDGLSSTPESSDAAYQLVAGLRDQLRHRSVVQPLWLQRQSVHAKLGIAPRRKAAGESPPIVIGGD